MCQFHSHHQPFQNPKRTVILVRLLLLSYRLLTARLPQASTSLLHSRHCFRRSSRKLQQLVPQLAVPCHAPHHLFCLCLPMTPYFRFTRKLSQRPQRNFYASRHSCQKLMRTETLQNLPRFFRSLKRRELPMYQHRSSRSLKQKALSMCQHRRSFRILKRRVRLMVTRSHQSPTCREINHLLLQTYRSFKRTALTSRWLTRSLI